MAHMARSLRSRPTGTPPEGGYWLPGGNMRRKNHGFHQHEGYRRGKTVVVIPERTLEDVNILWENKLKTWFDQDKIDEFKRVRSREQFLKYCDSAGLDFGYPLMKD